jgi:RNA polymerase sigma-70 factor, ECF subfamily
MSFPSATSITLLDRLRCQDPEGWRRFVQLYGPLIYHWCRRRNVNAEDAADIAQEVFQTVLAKMSDFRRTRATDSFRGWLWTITRFKMGDFFRRHERQAAAFGGSDAVIRLNELPETLEDDEEQGSDTSELVRRALQLIRAEFEERTWKAFWRVTVEGHAPKDVGQEMGITPDAVRMAKSRVLRRLREELSEGIDDPTLGI